VTHGPVDLALEAESTTAPAALADFQELHVSVLGLGRLQDGPRLESVDILEAALDDHGGHGRVGGHHCVDPAISVVGHPVRVGHVDADEGFPALDDPAAAGLAIAVLGGAIDVDELGHHLLALTHDDRVHERRHRLGVGERAHPTHQYHGVSRAPIAGAQRQAGHPQEPGDVDIVALIRDREADEIEVRQRTLRLE
jgi:hypothetical protein